MEWIIEHIDAIGAIAFAIIGIVKWYRDNRQLDKWDRIKALAPQIHDVVERIAREPPTKKDDLFVEKMNEVLKALGFELKPHEVEGVKILGTAAHESAKSADPLPARGEQ